MTNYYTTAIFSLMLCVNAISQQNDLAKQNFKGKVSSVQQIVYSPSVTSGKVTKGSKLTVFRDFYNFEATFNPAGNKSTETTDEGFTTEIIYHYNAQGKLTSTTESENKNPSHFCLRRYDDKNRLTEIVVCQDSVKGPFRKSQTLKYKQGNNPVEITRIDPEGFPLTTYYKHDQKNRLTEEGLAEAGDTSSWQKYRYNASGNKDLMVHEYGKVTYAYDQHNNVTKKIEYSTGGEEDRVTEYMYQYDSKGNWTTMIVSETSMFSDGLDAKYYLERTIKYFE